MKLGKSLRNYMEIQMIHLTLQREKNFTKCKLKSSMIVLKISQCGTCLRNLHFDEEFSLGVVYSLEGNLVVHLWLTVSYTTALLCQIYWLMWLDYGVLLYEGLGMTGSLPLLMYAVYVVVGASVNIIAAFIMDKVGRRPLFCMSYLQRLELFWPSWNQLWVS